MRKRRIIALASAAAVAFTAIGGGALVLAGPQPLTPETRRLAPVPAEEHLRTIAAMKPPKRARPVIAVVGHNPGTETTDYLIPYAVLKQSGAAEVIALATDAGPLKLKPALTIQAEATTAQFDARYPDGADYVIVPAIADRDNPQVVAWVKAQAAKGSTIVAVCAGALTVSAAGLLADRQATGHWYDVDHLQRSNPGMTWVRDRRYVADRGVVTTTGVSASLPVSLALVEAFAGRERAAAVARELGVAHWDARHHSAAFGFRRDLLLTALANRAAIWNQERYGIPVSPGVDELALGFAADAWSRTFRSQALAIAGQPGPIVTRRGLTLIPDRPRRAPAQMLPPVDGQSASALPAALHGIERRYGGKTARWVALQLEYPWRPAG
jgi:putative intracellular protease/amidase